MPMNKLATISPNGAIVNSQGRKPLVRADQRNRSPIGATPRMFASFLIVAINLTQCGMASTAAAESFPYVAYVIDPDTYVRSGPGNQNYPTGQVPAGFAVEVYRHDAEGWCAIRPPQGSFSLAPAHQMRIIDGRTAEVTASGVVARVGSSVASQRNAVQVMLERGEVVQLVESPVANDPWVKIAPPAGEFRWIAARRLSRMPPVELAKPVATSGSPWQSRSGGGTVVDPSDAFGHLLSAPPLAAGSPAPSATPDSYPRLEAEAIDVVAGSPAAVQLAQHLEPVESAPAANEPSAAAPADANQSATAGQPRIRFRGLSVEGPIDDRIAEMQLRLSQVVVEPPTTWQLGGLREETAAQVAAEQSPQVREQFRDLLDRIATFETVQARYRNMPNAAPIAAVPIAASRGVPAPGALPTTNANQNAPPQGLTGQSAEVLARVRSDLGIDDGVTPTPGGPPAPQQAATEALYDAVGTLKPVVSRREQAPRFALVDDHGDVVTFVTANSDVNLQPYVGQRIGVRGSRGFMPEYRRAHVTASRITPLEEKLIR